MLHVLRWRRGELAALVDAINATGYGLTHGIHTRIDETVAAILARIKAGNVYVNRNIVGAVVGVQPFGGHRLSGTGPKAGGPLYLRRLVRNAVAPVPTSRRSRCPARPANRIRSNSTRAASCCAWRATSARWSRRRRRRSRFGNKVMMLREPIALAARDRLEPVEVVLTDKLDPAAVDAVLLDVSAERARRVRAEFAARRGIDRADRRMRARWPVRLDAPRRRAHGDGQHGGGRRQCRAAVALRGRRLTAPRVGRPARFRTMRYFDAAAIRERLPWPRMLAALDAMLKDDVAAPLRAHHPIDVPGEPTASLLLMPAWRLGQRIGVKLVTVFPGNAQRGERAVGAVYALFDARNGKALALFDGEEITACRTAGASAYAANRLARKDARHLVLVGSGRIARRLAEAHRFVRPIERVSVWSRTPEHARAAAADIERDGLRGRRSRRTSNARCARPTSCRAPRCRRRRSSAANGCRPACISTSSGRSTPACARPTMPRWRARISWSSISARRRWREGGDIVQAMRERRLDRDATSRPISPTSRAARTPDARAPTR